MTVHLISTCPHDPQTYPPRKPRPGARPWPLRLELILLDTRTSIRLVLASCFVVGVVASLGHLQTAQATTRPISHHSTSAEAARRSHVSFPSPPAWWLSQAHCIEHYESHDTDATSNPFQRGWLQFDWNRGHSPWGTWGSVGGVGDPAAASRAEQEYRGWLEWNHIAVDHRPEHWRPWTTASRCGL